MSATQKCFTAVLLFEISKVCVWLWSFSIPRRYSPTDLVTFLGSNEFNCCTEKLRFVCLMDVDRYLHICFVLNKCFANFY